MILHKVLSLSYSVLVGPRNFRYIRIDTCDTVSLLRSRVGVTLRFMRTLSQPEELHGIRFEYLVYERCFGIFVGFNISTHKSCRFIINFLPVLTTPPIHPFPQAINACITNLHESSFYVLYIRIWS